MRHGESIEVCAGIIYKGADIIRKKHLSEDEIHEQLAKEVLGK